MADAGAAVDDNASDAQNLMQAQVSSRRDLSCTTCFDALWFCYSPVHQMQQYYRGGNFDTCFDKWNALFDCFHLKTKPASEMKAILESREKDAPHIWTFRTTEEASREWNKVFGHLNDD